MKTSAKKTVFKQNADRKLRWRNISLHVLIGIMMAVVLYDSFAYKTPLYYILFFFLGSLAGKLHGIYQKVERDQSTGKFRVKSNALYIIFSMALLLFRFVFGIKWLESLHIFYASDALYLIFIGIYSSKIYGIDKQIDELVYSIILSSNKKN